MFRLHWRAKRMKVRVCAHNVGLNLNDSALILLTILSIFVLIKFPIFIWSEQILKVVIIT